MLEPKACQSVTKLPAVPITMGIHATIAFIVPVDRSSGFLIASSAMVDRAPTTSCFWAAGNSETRAAFVKHQNRLASTGGGRIKQLSPRPLPLAGFALTTVGRF